jgi:hypothetical protein
MTWGIYLDVNSEEDAKRRLHSLKEYLERHFTYGLGDGISICGLLRGQVVKWAEDAMLVEWRTDARTILEGKELLFKLRKADYKEKGYDVDSCRIEGTPIDVLEKEVAKQTKERPKTTRYGGSNRRLEGAKCYTCNAPGHLQKNCPQNRAIPTLPPTQRQPRYNERVCAFCQARGARSAGHTEDKCFLKFPHLRTGFQQGGSPTPKL